MKLILSPAALSDIQSIADYTFQTWGAEQEIRYLEGLWDRFEEIRECPECFKLRTDLLKGCRSARFGKHVIFFAIEDSSVEVIRILHSAMDFSSQLKPE